MFFFLGVCVCVPRGGGWWWWWRRRGVGLDVRGWWFGSEGRGTEKSTGSVFISWCLMLCCLLFCCFPELRHWWEKFRTINVWEFCRVLAIFKAVYFTKQELENEASWATDDVMEIGLELCTSDFTGRWGFMRKLENFPLLLFLLGGQFFLNISHDWKIGAVKSSRTGLVEIYVKVGAAYNFKHFLDRPSSFLQSHACFCGFVYVWFQNDILWLISRLTALTGCICC